MNDEIKNKIIEIVKSETGFDVAGLDLNAGLSELSSMDSMQFVQISVKIEKELDIELPLSVMKAGTIKEFLDIIDQELNKK